MKNKYIYLIKKKNYISLKFLEKSIKNCLNIN